MCSIPKMCMPLQCVACVYCVALSTRFCPCTHCTVEQCVPFSHAPFLSLTAANCNTEAAQYEMITDVRHRDTGALHNPTATPSYSNTTEHHYQEADVMSKRASSVLEVSLLTMSYLYDHRPIQCKNACPLTSCTVICRVVCLMVTLHVWVCPLFAQTGIVATRDFPHLRVCAHCGECVCVCVCVCVCTCK